MAHVTIRGSLATILALSALVACKDNPPAQTPAGVTTTTGAQTDERYPPVSPDTTTPTQGTTPRMERENAPTNDGNAASTNVPTSPMEATASTTPGPAPMPTTGVAANGAMGAATASNVGAATEAPLTDAQIVAIVEAANQGEVEQGREALRHTKSDRVRAFAQHMVSDHTAADSKLATVATKEGITPQRNGISGEIKANGEQLMASLKSVNGADFDRAYADGQVAEHAKVLDLLDNRLIPQAQSADLKKTLQQIRAKVAMHLSDAQVLQGSTGGSK